MSTEITMASTGRWMKFLNMIRGCGEVRREEVSE
jgi:hypothetical protein